MDKSNAWNTVAQDIEILAAKEAVKITNGPTKEKTSEFKTKQPKESLMNWKPLHNDWAATTSKPKEVQANNPKDNKYRYNRKGFLEDYDSSDDSIFIVDQGWDDYCLQELKLNRLILLALKNYKSIYEKQKKLESRVQNCQEKLESCEELLRKTQSETRKSLQQISTEIQQSKPLTKREVLNLVQEIAEQPKLVEKEALGLTEDLNQKIQKVEHLLHDVKNLVTG
ncbi:Orf y [Tanacetum coccineum]